MLRAVAALSLVLGMVALLGFLHLLGKGPFASLEMRHLRAMKERRDPPTAYQPATLASFEALPHRQTVAEYSALERRGVVMEGYVQRMVRAPDGDTHLELVATARGADGLDTMYVTAEVSPQHRRDSPRWGYRRLLTALRPNHGGATAWDGGPRRVRIAGWLLYDFQYDQPPSEYSRIYNAPRVSGWEIHPVTSIALWDAAHSRFVDYPR